MRDIHRSISISNLDASHSVEDDPVLSWITHELSSKRSVKFRVFGGSMRPSIPSGASVTINPMIDQNPKLGDVLLFKGEGRNLLILHRVLWVSREHIITKGDRNPRCDIPNMHSQILGILTHIDLNDLNITGLSLNQYLGLSIPGNLATRCVSIMLNITQGALMRIRDQISR